MRKKRVFFYDFEYQLCIHPLSQTMNKCGLPYPNRSLYDYIEGLGCERRLYTRTTSQMEHAVIYKGQDYE